MLWAFLWTLRDILQMLRAILRMLRATPVMTGAGEAGVHPAERPEPHDGHGADEQRLRSALQRRRLSQGDGEATHHPQLGPASQPRLDIN
eukprot:1175556-Prorocentrum_minimum.AAC.1